MIVTLHPQESTSSRCKRPAEAIGGSGGNEDLETDMNLKGLKEDNPKGETMVGGARAEMGGTRAEIGGTRVEMGGARGLPRAKTG